jgi:predicted TIM-barrel fold metal-dependent hydrolase
MRAALGLLALCAAGASAALGRLIDTHLHITNMTLFSYPWMTQVMQCPCAPPCACDWSLADYAAATAAAPASKLVFVEVAAAPQFWLAEAQWVQSLIDAGGAGAAIGAIIAQRPPGFGVPGADAGALARDLAALAALRSARGVRAGALDWANATAVAAVLPHYELLRASGLRTADVITSVTAAAAAGIAALARAQPGLALVLDHAGSPPVLGNASAIADWRAGMAALGALPNVYVKWGGLAQYFKAAGAVPTLAQVAPFAGFALDAFPGRAVFERNWFFWCVPLRAPGGVRALAPPPAPSLRSLPPRTLHSAQHNAAAATF